MGDFSKEFCGGTHVSNTGALGVFKIISEESIGSGVRRITSVTKMKAYDTFKAEEEYLLSAASILKMHSYSGFKEKISALIEENNALKKQIALQNEKAMAMEAQAMQSKAETYGDISALILELKDKDSGSLKAYAEKLRNGLKNGFVLISNEGSGKVTFVCASSKEAIAKGLKAGDIVKKAAQITGGNGGGRPDMAQAGGRDTAKINEALESVRETLKQL